MQKWRELERASLTRKKKKLNCKFIAFFEPIREPVTGNHLAQNLGRERSLKGKTRHECWLTLCRHKWTLVKRVPLRGLKSWWRPSVHWWESMTSPGPQKLGESAISSGFFSTNSNEHWQKRLERVLRKLPNTGREIRAAEGWPQDSTRTPLSEFSHGVKALICRGKGNKRSCLLKKPL